MDDIGAHHPNRSKFEISTGTSASPEPLAVRIADACRLTGIGRSKLYELVGAGEIEVIKVGAITLVPMNSLRLFIQTRRRLP
ncbi:MAG TPA: helix-turn-helix domain-containing protein [Allosphingosinicella sp.]